MVKKNSEQKGNWKYYLLIIFSILIGGIFGLFMIRYADSIFQAEEIKERLLFLCVLSLSLYVAILVHVIFHEIGHLIFGRISGYHFVSIRIYSVVLVKEMRRLKFRRYAIPGTLGQCLMEPPNPVSWEFPTTLYNLGGILMNAILGIIFLIFYFVYKDRWIISSIFLAFALVGFFFILANGIPFITWKIDNDARTIFLLNRGNKSTHCAFWTHLKVNAEMSRGVRLRDMPWDWFALVEGKKDHLTASLDMLIVRHLMDLRRFRDAYKLATHFIETDNQHHYMLNLQRNMIICDRIYAALMIKKNYADIYDITEQIEFMQSVKYFPSVFRTYYAYALLVERSRGMAEEIKQEFEKLAKVYPYPSEIQSEQELIELIDTFQS